MHHYPTFINLKDKVCVVIGGGLVAERKVKALLKAEANVVVVAPEITERLQTLTQKHIAYEAREYAETDLAGAFLVIAATDNKDINRQVGEYADSQNMLVNVVDNPDLCNFIVPSIVDRSPVRIAVSTGGASPVLARQLRMKLETMVPASCGELAAITEEYRNKVKARFATGNERKTFWESALKGPFAELVYAGQVQDARRHLDKLLESGSGKSEMGEVYLVGAGPGDPDLLTFKAVRLMQQADVMVYDRLVSKTILDMANRQAERIYVGKEKANHAVPQDRINDLLVELAKQGKRVLRLKGGDPFIFGRGGEEIETLAEEGVPFQVVPAVTAASGCSSYAGIPLTHRDYAQSVCFATGHLKDGTINLNWEHLTQENQTVVFYMGLTGIKVISQELQEHGMSPDMPAALIEQGTTRNQRVHIGTLATLPELVETSGVRAPTLTIIGNVVKLHDKLHWYEPERHVAASEFSKNDPK
ncbi:MAG: Siroheme synthase / Precorrin-2 oxidase (EC / Sirohydrochlorin ferrochelatase (EC / Uroporphyrinogen-III methyltransferase (EC [uncultured Thiotrichaceae bacterium]|uniref:Siroheme synthase n=1 Tax=uncultured Thiotrichaceae bacterium TaxID=298394 RepID=A0A6S6TGT3_9GAMM|nr:MAG: Siroheme synthase / Precorrin-2 oxidase (EC / Sirohydrochlorin ferrochelatase (EC / Uroporphyrinogen-III methyltransferase (EC [uncultured Thiotrichaceae bacterium]